MIALAERGALFDPGPCMCGPVLLFTCAVAQERLAAHMRPSAEQSPFLPWTALPPLLQGY